MIDLISKFNLENPMLIPAFIGLGVPGIALFYFAFIDKNKKGIIVSTFAVLISGFILPLIIENRKYITDFSKEYEKILSFPIISTVIGIFMANRLLKYFADSKEKRETSVLFANAIDSQIRALAYIDLYLLSTFIGENLSYIEIYNERLNNNQYYITAFNKIGIYSELEINLISRYSTSLQELSSYTQKLLLEYNSEKIYEKFKKKHELQYFRTFTITKISISLTLILGILSSYTLSQYFTSNNLEDSSNAFLKDYDSVINRMIKIFDFTDFFILNSIVARNLVDHLKYVRKVYIKIAGITSYKNPIFICLMSFNEDIIHSMAFCDREKKTENCQFLTLLRKKDNIVAFGNSEEEALKKVKNLAKSRIKNFKTIEDVLKKSEIQVELISP